MIPGPFLTREFTNTRVSERIAANKTLTVASGGQLSDRVEADNQAANVTEDTTPTLVSKVAEHYRKEGLFGPLRRAGQRLNRRFIPRAFVLFCCDIKNLSAEPNEDNGLLAVARTKMGEVSGEEFADLAKRRGEGVARAQLEERFAKGAILWLAKMDDRVVASRWTIWGKTVEPYFFPLRDKDVHFFDAEVDADARGLGINHRFIRAIFRDLKLQGCSCAFVETKVWNKPCLRSFARTEFREVAEVYQFKILGRNIVIWRPGPSKVWAEVLAEKNSRQKG